VTLAGETAPPPPNPTPVRAGDGPGRAGERSTPNGDRPGRAGERSTRAGGRARASGRPPSRPVGAVAPPAGSPFRFEAAAASRLRKHRSESLGWKIFRKVRSSLGLVVIAMGLGLALAGAIGGLIWAIAAAIHSAAGQ
jgi:hypothetical protein